MTPDSQAAIDRFVDAVWLEDGLSANTLAAYRRDLKALADWLEASGIGPLESAQEAHLQAFPQLRLQMANATGTRG